MKSRPRHTLAQRINRAASKKNIPLGVLIELTYRCNNHCYYCFQQGHPKTRELSNKKWFDILGQLAAAGTLYLTFSGGEPLIREDFLSIVERAISLNFGVSVITNGGLLTPSTIQRLASLGILDIGISFHAAQACLHDRLSGVPGSFAGARKGLDLCIAAGLKTIVKHTVSSMNFGEYTELDKLCQSSGALFEYDCFVLPGETGTVSPFGLTRQQFLRFNQSRNVAPLDCSKTSDAAARLHCDAGRSIAGINPKGDVMPCILLPLSLGNCSASPFITIWNSEPARQFRLKERSLAPACRDCNSKQYCSRCHGLAFLEAGNWRGQSPSLCRYAASIQNAASVGNARCTG